MAQQKPTSPYFKSVHSSPPSPFPTPISTPILPRYTRRQYTKSAEMVNFSKLDTKSLIEAAMTPSSSPPRTSQPKQLTPYTLEEPETVDTVSRKRTRTSDEARLSDDSISGSDSSEETFVAKPRKKKQKQLVDDDGVVYDAPQRPLRNKGKGRASMAEQIDDDDDNDDDDNNAALQPVKSTRPKSTSTSRKSSSSSRKASTAPKPRKPVGTPVPTSLEDAHPADKELFKMKADGKPWKQIKPVWEKLMCKQTGDSTLSVRYYKMKENFAKAGGKDDMRLLKFKAKVEAQLEADKWERVAKMTEDDGGKVMTAREVRLRFKDMERDGFQVSAANSDDVMPEVTYADMDAIDRELAGVGEAGNASGLSDLEQSDVDESMDFEREVDRAGGEIGGLTLVEQRLIGGFGEANALGDVELDSGGRLVNIVGLGDGTLVDELSSKLVQEHSEESIVISAKVEEGGRGEF